MKAEEYLEQLEKISVRNFQEHYYGSYDRALWYLLKGNIEYVRYGLEEGDIDYFMKSFRQIDVTNNAYIDMAIWVLLGESPNALWLLNFMRNWDKERPITESDVISAMLDIQ